MNSRLVEEIAAAVLYEGYLLYPYRASAIKNRQRWNFGVLCPRAYAAAQSGADAWSTRTECLVKAPAESTPLVRVRFLHLIAQTIQGQTWQGAMERDVRATASTLAELCATPVHHRSLFPPAQNQRPVEAVIEIDAKPLDRCLFKLRVTISNMTASTASSREDALLESMVSTHTILGIDQGEFVSLLDPPEDLRDAAESCSNSGTWPVLAGDAGARDVMLSSPIILYDYPQIAPESPGALFDGTEIDEILTLRILTLTDQEKREMSLADERAREILERTESMSPEQLFKLHGVLRGTRELPGETS